MTPDPDSESLGDWRLHFAGWATELGGKPIDPTPVVQMTVRAISGGDVVLPTPSAAALHLNAAWKAARRASEVRQHVVWQARLTYPAFGTGGRQDRHVHPDTVARLFDFFEEAMSAAGGSYAAIEAFCNVTIAERVKGTMQLDRPGRKPRQVTAPQAEWLPTEEKVNRVVPALMSNTSLESSSAWPAFQRLKSLRDSITHFKRRDYTRPGEVEPSALLLLLDADPFDYPECAMAVIRHLAGHPPRWMHNPGWRRPSGPSSGAVRVPQAAET